MKLNTTFPSKSFNQSDQSIHSPSKYVLLPRARIDKGAGLRKWDLWGPLFLCLALSTILGVQAQSEQAGSAFALVFIIVWLGSAVVTLNSLLLKGEGDSYLLS
jgi:protein YIPF6